MGETEPKGGDLNSMTLEDLKSLNKEDSEQLMKIIEAADIDSLRAMADRFDRNDPDRGADDSLYQKLIKELADKKRKEESGEVRVVEKEEE